ncbi:hypothetical protein U27_01311 [Candidatus Vecturithrix granuli]|uniref:Lcl C-terminal domain-containing protein n=1 Tax=Vecturithrix granuli TaxID=1499967 RepID=A0A081CA06_VECG1|nr:hypothetical protein U27_01311 [Candidatus Vecturithrix granuli]
MRIAHTAYLLIFMSFLANCTRIDSTAQSEVNRKAQEESIASCPKVPLRSTPLTLTSSQIENMVKKYGFYERVLHPRGERSYLYYEMRLDGDLIVVDCTHDLVWTAGLDMYASHEKANEVVATARYAGLRDWRVPTIEELASLLTPSQSGLYLNPAFENFRGKSVWSADRVNDQAQNAGWIVRFDEGRIEQASVYEFHQMLLVRDLGKLPIDSKTGASLRGLPKDW